MKNISLHFFLKKSKEKRNNYEQQHQGRKEMNFDTFIHTETNEHHRCDMYNKNSSIDTVP